MDLGEGPAQLGLHPLIFRLNRKKLGRLPPAPPHISQGVDDRAPSLSQGLDPALRSIFLIINIQPELHMTLRKNHTLIERVAYG